LKDRHETCFDRNADRFRPESAVEIVGMKPKIMLTRKW